MAKRRAKKKSHKRQSGGKNKKMSRGKKSVRRARRARSKRRGESSRAQIHQGVGSTTASAEAVPELPGDASKI